MCDLAVDVGALCREHGAAASSLDGELVGLALMVADGIVEVDGRRVRMTELGRPFIRLVAAAFDATETDQPAYSRAV
jgi:oxygen-independent coproporphyrinogen-3 oxidase